jgi:hypothetical protein
MPVHLLDRVLLLQESTGKNVRPSTLEQEMLERRCLAAKNLDSCLLCCGDVRLAENTDCFPLNANQEVQQLHIQYSVQIY